MYFLFYPFSFISYKFTEQIIIISQLPPLWRKKLHEVQYIGTKKKFWYCTGVHKQKLDYNTLANTGCGLTLESFRSEFTANL